MNWYATEWQSQLLIQTCYEFSFLFSQVDYLIKDFHNPTSLRIFFKKENF